MRLGRLLRGADGSSRSPAEKPLLRLPVQSGFSYDLSAISFLAARAGLWPTSSLLPRDDSQWSGRPDQMIAGDGIGADRVFFDTVTSSPAEDFRRGAG